MVLLIKIQHAEECDARGDAIKTNCRVHKSGSVYFEKYHGKNTGKHHQFY